MLTHEAIKAIEMLLYALVALLPIPLLLVSVLNRKKKGVALFCAASYILLCGCYYVVSDPFPLHTNALSKESFQAIYEQLRTSTDNTAHSFDLTLAEGECLSSSQIGFDILRDGEPKPIICIRMHVTKWFNTDEAKVAFGGADDSDTLGEKKRERLYWASEDGSFEVKLFQIERWKNTFFFPPTLEQVYYQQEMFFRYNDYTVCCAETSHSSHFQMNACIIHLLNHNSNLEYWLTHYTWGSVDEDGTVVITSMPELVEPIDVGILYLVP